MVQIALAINGNPKKADARVHSTMTTTADAAPRILPNPHPKPRWNDMAISWLFGYMYPTFFIYFCESCLCLLIVRGYMRRFNVQKLFFGKGYVT